MHRHSLTSLSVLKGWRYYLTMRRLDTNAEASSAKSYFGLTPLAFAARSAPCPARAPTSLVRAFARHLLGGGGMRLNHAECGVMAAAAKGTWTFST